MSAEAKVERSRNEQIGAAFKHFGEAEKVPQEALTQWCERQHVEVITTGEYSDWLFQRKHDARMSALLPEITKALCSLRYVPGLATDAEASKIRKENDALVVEIAKLIEKSEVPYLTLENVTTEIAAGLHGIVKKAVTTINNKSGEALLEIAKKHFGTDEVHVGHIAKYAEELYAKKETA